MYGILTDKTILSAMEAGTIKIDPFNPQQLNPVSYDVTLGDQLTLYRRWVLYSEGGSLSPDGRHGHAVYSRSDSVLDAKEEPEMVSFQIDPEKGWVLRPGIGYLMHTRERIWTERYIPILDGKSSIGRLFIQIHATAGFGDPGFDGQYTLEVIVQHPVRVYPGMRIGQIRFHTMHGEVSKTYDKVGHYTGKAAQGAVGSQAWRQFKK